MPGRTSIQFVWVPDLAIIAEAYFTMAERAQQMVDPMEDATATVATEIDLNFEVEGRPTPWAPLAPRTLHQRFFGLLAGVSDTAQKTFKEGTEEWQGQVQSAFAASLKILQRTGALRKGATDPESWQVVQSGRETVATLYDDTGYGHFHVTGAPASHMPARDYTYISDEAMDEIENMFADWILEPW